jgi:iron(III) transport system permease protein
MLSGPAGLAMILVAVDVIKELPATFLLRPFGFDTLATVTFQSASLENYEAAAGPALMMTALSLLAVTLVFPKLPKSEGK